LEPTFLNSSSLIRLDGYGAEFPLLLGSAKATWSLPTLKCGLEQLVQIFIPCHIPTGMLKALWPVNYKTFRAVAPAVLKDPEILSLQIISHARFMTVRSN